LNPCSPIAEAGDIQQKEQTMMKRTRRRRERRTALSGWQWLLALCFAVLPAMPQIPVEAQTEQQSTQGAADGSELSPREKKVIEYLQGVWGKDHSVMSVDQAMDAVGLPPSDEARFRIGQYIKQHPELHVIVRRWGWETLVLTPDEKLIARAIINTAREQQPAPTLAEIAKAVGVSQNDAKRGLAMLERYQILKRDEAVVGAGYAVAAPRYLNWNPRLDFVFHRMTVSSGRNTSVN
jgi:hypothetical protein